MRVEVSKLFSLNFAPDWVTNAHVGDGVYIQEIKLSGWLADFCKKLQRVSEEFYQDLLAFQRFQWRPYTHRFYISLDGAESWNDERVKRATELIYKATVLVQSRKTDPCSSAWRNVFVRTLRLSP